MDARAKWILGLCYALALLVPFVLVGALSATEIETWLATGMCPGGPMDRSAAPCGPFALFQIIFLGGWAAFIVVPVIAVWWAVCTAVCGLLVATVRRRTAGRTQSGAA